MNRPLIVTAVLMLALGGGVGYWVASKSVKEQARSALPEQKKTVVLSQPDESVGHFAGACKRRDGHGLRAGICRRESY